MSIYKDDQPFPAPCPECQGMRVTTTVTGISLARPAFYKGEVTGYKSIICPLLSVVCIQCGHTTLFAGNVQKVRKELEQHPQDFQEAAFCLLQQQNRR